MLDRPIETGELGDAQRTRVPVWLYAPVGRDAALLRSAVPRGDGVRTAREPEDLARAFAEPGELGVLVMTQEALTTETLSLLDDALERQPVWSELPIVLLVDAAGNTIEALARLREALPRTKVLVLQRPVRLSELETAVEAQRRSRLRQYELRSYVERQEVLRRELNHRVKNILATVQALYGLTVRTADDLEDFDQVFQPRLTAMARVHEVLFAADYGEVGLGPLARAVLAPYAGDARVAMAGPDATLSSEAGQSLALVIHELATNAAKHGALRAEDGRVRLEWSVRDDVLELRWTEAGGPPVRPPTRRGYGVSFVEMSLRGLGGEAVLTYEPEGFGMRATLPLPDDEEGA